MSGKPIKRIKEGMLIKGYNERYNEIVEKILRVKEDGTVVTEDTHSEKSMVELDMIRSLLTTDVVLTKDMIEVAYLQIDNGSLIDFFNNASVINPDGAFDNSIFTFAVLQGNSTPRTYKVEIILKNSIKAHRLNIITQYASGKSEDITITVYYEDNTSITVTKKTGVSPYIPIDVDNTKGILRIDIVYPDVYFTSVPLAWNNVWLYMITFTKGMAVVVQDSNLAPINPATKENQETMISNQNTMITGIQSIDGKVKTMVNGSFVDSVDNTSGTAAITGHKLISADDGIIRDEISIICTAGNITVYDSAGNSINVPSGISVSFKKTKLYELTIDIPVGGSFIAVAGGGYQ